MWRNAPQLYVPSGLKKSDAFPSTYPEAVTTAIMTLFPAFWSLFFTYKHERNVTDPTAYEYAKAVATALKEPLPGTDTGDLESLRKSYADAVRYFTSSLISLGNAHLLEDRAYSTARSRLHSILVQWYHRYRREYEQTRNPRSRKPWIGRPPVIIRPNPEIAKLEEIGIIEPFNTKELVERTRKKMDAIFSEKKAPKRFVLEG